MTAIYLQCVFLNLQTIGGSAEVLERNILLTIYREVTANASQSNRQTSQQVSGSSLRFDVARVL
jgi:hypothetical protein